MSRHFVDLLTGRRARVRRRKPKTEPPTPERLAAIALLVELEDAENARKVQARLSCTSCADTTYLPRHAGSRYCESGSIASGGTRPHCACDWCF